nr:PIN domain-containing protein [Microbacterium sp. TL13]
MILYPDTNALHADLLMLRSNSRELVGALLEGQVEVALSPVVLAEAQRQVREQTERSAREMDGYVRGIERRFGVSAPGAESALAHLMTQVALAGNRALAPLLASSACKVLDWPQVESQELVSREIERRLPSRLQGGQSTGLRDTIIWHGLIELLASVEDEDRVLFMTADSGFVKGDALAPDLLQEIEDGGFDTDRLEVVTQFATALIRVNERRDLLTEQDGLIRQAVIDHLAAFDGQTWAGVDVAGEAHLPYGIEEGVVVAVDSITIERAEGIPPTSLTATADITISGWMRTDEYVQEYGDFVEWNYGELHDPMIGVDFTATVALEAEVEVTADGLEAWVSDETLRWLE